MFAAGCVIEGTVINSVLSPGVVVKKGATVRDSVIFEDSIIEAGAEVDLVVADKRIHVGCGAVVGCGDAAAKKIVNKEVPTHLYSGITLVGKEARIPEGMKIGRNCIVQPGYGRVGASAPSAEECQHGAVFSAG
jgi:glucose-1-phosphate adenylyltransferase